MRKAALNLLLAFLLPLASVLGAVGDLFPKMPPAPRVYAADVSRDSEDARRTALALQGIINQQSAEVYTINNWWDRPPIKECGKPFEPLVELSGTNAGLRNLFVKYQKRVKKMFVYAPDKDWTWYLALMSSAQQGGIPVTEKLRADLEKEFQWKGEVEDFRDRWANRVAAYDWALTNLMPGCSRKVVFALECGLPLTDYAVASKGFVFWLDFEKEQAAIKKIFQTKGYGVGTSLMGYGSNGDFANATANHYGIGYVVSCLYANGSFWSSFPNKTYNQLSGQAVEAQPGKIYAAIIWSDGDNLEYDQNPLWKYWQDPGRGTIPVGTTLSPTLRELNTPLLDWYYANRTPKDELLAGPTGFQFIHIHDFDAAQYSAWLELNHTWCASAGFHSVYMWSMLEPNAKYRSYVNSCGLSGGSLGTFLSFDTNLPSVRVSGVTDESRMLPSLEWLRPKTNAPVFHASVCIAGGFYRDGDRAYSALKRQIDRFERAHPDRYVFLLPRDLFATMRAYAAAHPPPREISGNPATDNGLAAVNDADGQFTVTERGSSSCWIVPKYLYFDALDTFLPESGGIVEIEAEYLDAGSGVFGLQYDSTNPNLPDRGAFKQHLMSVRRTNSQRWQLARFRINDARFAGRQANDLDFRFWNTGDDLVIRAVRIRRIAPQ